MATTSNTITATAGQTEFSFSFPYLKKESIKVTIDTVATTAFTIPDNNPTTVILDSGATAGQIIVISRLTSTTATPATFFSGGAIRSQDLNNNFDSILYITQEKENQLTEVIAGGIANNSITSDKLANNSVGTAALIDGSVAEVDLANDAVTTAKIINNAVTTVKIINDAVTTPKIANNAVTTDKVIDDAVTTAKIINDAVTTPKIVNDAVTTPKIINDAVITVKIINDAVTTAKIADANVTTAKIADDAVTTDKIANSSVNPDKLAATVILLPTGAITAFGGSTAPTGYLECNGQSTSGYTALAAVVGANVPDLRGEFVRGWDNGKGTDSGRALGSSQTADLASHRHTIDGYSIDESSNRSPSHIISDDDRATTAQSKNTNYEGGAETRPRNVALMYIIKT